MKKILLVTAFLIGYGMTATSNLKENSAELNILQEKQFNAIEISSISADVLKNVSSDFSGFKINEALVAKDGEYKLILVKDENTSSCYFKANCEFIKET